MAEERPAPESFLDLVAEQRKGRLKIYVGAAAGVGKTWRMLEEAHELRDKGIDVVLGFIETHGRADTMAKVYAGCRTAGIGCIECKGWAADSIVARLAPMQERRKKYEQNPRLAWDILEAGSAKAGKAAEATMQEARSAMHMSKEFEAPAAGAAGKPNS